MKTYVITVLRPKGNEVVRVPGGRRGLKKYIKALGLSYDRLRETYADEGVPIQVHLEWSEEPQTLAQKMDQSPNRPANERIK